MFRSIIRFSAALAALAALADCSSVPAPDFEFSPQAQEGLIVMDAEPTGGLLKPGGSYELEIEPFDPATHTFAINSLHGRPDFTGLGQAQTERAYFVAKAHPGFYALEWLSVNMHWGACYNGGTDYFEVKPGAVTYLGRFDPKPSIAQVALAGFPHFASQNTFYYVFDTPRPPIRQGADIPGHKEEVAAFLAKSYPKIVAPIEGAKLVPTSFNTGHNAISFQKLCGGWYAKPKTDDPTPKP